MPDEPSRHQQQHPAQGGVREIFDPLRVHPTYTFLSSNYNLNNSFFLVARDGIPKNLKSIFFFHRGLTPAAFLPQQAFISPWGGTLVVT